MSNENDFNTTDILLNFFYKNLENLSTIKEGCKIYINSDNIIIIDEPYMFQGLWRYYNSMSRYDAIEVITKLFDNIERYFNSLYIKTCMIKNKNKHINIPEPIKTEFKLIIEKMNNAKQGIANLCITYKDDSGTVTLLNNIIINIDTMITTFTKLYSTNFI